MFQLHVWLSIVIFLLSLNDLVTSIFDAFPNGRPCYYIKRLVHSVYNKISGANIYSENLK